MRSENLLPPFNDGEKIMNVQKLTRKELRIALKIRESDILRYIGLGLSYLVYVLSFIFSIVFISSSHIFSSLSPSGSQVETLVRLVVAAILIGDVTALIIPSIFKVSCGFFKTKEDTTAKQLKNKMLISLYLCLASYIAFVNLILMFILMVVLSDAPLLSSFRAIRWFFELSGVDFTFYMFMLSLSLWTSIYMTIIVSRQSTIIKEVKSVSNPLNSLKQPYSGMKRYMAIIRMVEEEKKTKGKIKMELKKGVKDDRVISYTILAWAFIFTICLTVTPDRSTLNFSSLNDVPYKVDYNALVKRFGNPVYSNEHNGTYLFLEGDDINPSETYDSLTEVEEATRDKKLNSLWLKYNVRNGKISDAILHHDQVGYKAEDEANINGRHYYQELVLDPEQPVKTINDFVVELGNLYIDNDVLRRTAVIEHFKAYLKEQNFCSKFYLDDGVTGVISDFQPTYKINTYGISFDKEGNLLNQGCFEVKAIMATNAIYWPLF